jgi:hypothetical protein
MSVFIDRNFLLQVSPKLQRFAQKKDDLYNFRCPLCGDSQKNKSKSRGYVFRKTNDYFYKCHNCHVCISFYNFLEKVDPELLKEYQLERYKDGNNNKTNHKAPTFEEFKGPRPVFKKAFPIPSVESLPDDHYAKNYVTSRKIPEQFYKTLYFAEDFKQFVESLQIPKEGLQANDPRLVIPFYDKDKNLIAFQGRALGESKLRYITVKTHEDNPKVFGLDRIDEEKKIYVTEGPIDSMFVDNCVATADANLPSITRVLDKSRVVLIFDNEPRNQDIVKKMEECIEEHHQLVIWPEMMEEYKDINEMILGGFTTEEIQDIIDNNTFVNLRAKMEFINWKRI